MVERFRWRFWSVNVVLFVCLAVPALLVGGAGWPLRLAATAGLAGACVWEAAALRARRVPLWADVLETVAVAVVSWRYPTGMGLLVLVLAFALPALGFRVLYSTPWQAAARTVTVLAAVYAGSIHDPSALLHGMPPVILAAVVVVFLSGELARMYHQRAAVAYRWRIAARLNADLAAARGRGDVHTAILRAVLDLLQGQTDVRVIIWDEPSSLQPTVAAGSLAGEVRPGGGQPLSAVTWVRDALVAGELAYRESYDVDQMRRVLGFDPIPGVILVVPLRHGEDVRALSVDASEPIPAPVRAEIANLAKVGEIALGSIERTRVNLEELRERSSYDPHTHLGNRDLPRLRLEQALAPGRPVALLLLHIGHFRTINDSLGNISGGEALVTLAGRLVGCVRPGDTVARLGGDEFAILLNPLADPATAERVASHVLGVLDEPLPSIILGSRTGMFVRGSIGVALSGPAARTPNDLLRNAEVAMDAAETAGGGVYRVFEPAMRASILQRLELESDLSRALDRDELVLHYQPIVQLPAWRPISGVEALIRWNHPQRGMVSPARFIPAAEETGLITQIGAWVLREACRQLRAWSATRPELAGLTLGVNLSPVQLAQADLTRTIGRIIGEVGVDPGRIVVELTESALVEPTAANLAKLQELKTLGLRLAADDFGTGFSSLSYLQRFPLDHLKIDRSFVHGVDVDDGAAALANSIITMGHALQLKCVAEGVETAGQADWLARTDCDAAQGHFLRPGVAPRPAAPAPHQRAPPVLEARAAGMTSACSRQEAP